MSNNRHGCLAPFSLPAICQKNNHNTHTGRGSFTFCGMNKSKQLKEMRRRKVERNYKEMISLQIPSTTQHKHERRKEETERAPCGREGKRGAGCTIIITCCFIIFCLFVQVIVIIIMTIQNGGMDCEVEEFWWNGE